MPLLDSLLIEAISSKELHAASKLMCLLDSQASRNGIRTVDH